jgi:hypothetical protein
MLVSASRLFLEEVNLVHVRFTLAQLNNYLNKKMPGLEEKRKAILLSWTVIAASKNPLFSKVSR